MRIITSNSDRGYQTGVKISASFLMCFNKSLVSNLNIGGQNVSDATYLLGAVVKLKQLGYDNIYIPEGINSPNLRAFLNGLGFEKTVVDAVCRTYKHNRKLFNKFFKESKKFPNKLNFVNLKRRTWGPTFCITLESERIEGVESENKRKGVLNIYVKDFNISNLNAAFKSAFLLYLIMSALLVRERRSSNRENGAEPVCSYRLKMDDQSLCKEGGGRRVSIAINTLANRSGMSARTVFKYIHKIEECTDIKIENNSKYFFFKDKEKSDKLYKTYPESLGYRHQVACKEDGTINHIVYASNTYIFPDNAKLFFNPRARRWAVKAVRALPKKLRRGKILELIKQKKYWVPFDKLKDPIFNISPKLKPGVYKGKTYRFRNPLYVALSVLEKIGRGEPSNSMKIWFDKDGYLKHVWVQGDVEPEITDDMVLVLDYNALENSITIGSVKKTNEGKNTFFTKGDVVLCNHPEFNKNIADENLEMFNKTANIFHESIDRLMDGVMRKIENEEGCWHTDVKDNNDGFHEPLHKVKKSAFETNFSITCSWFHGIKRSVFLDASYMEEHLSDIRSKSKNIKRNLLSFKEYAEKIQNEICEGYSERCEKLALTLIREIYRKNKKSGIGVFETYLSMNKLFSKTRNKKKVMANKETFLKFIHENTGIDIYKYDAKIQRFVYYTFMIKFVYLPYPDLYKDLQTEDDYKACIKSLDKERAERRRVRRLNSILASQKKRIASYQREFETLTRSMESESELPKINKERYFFLKKELNEFFNGSKEEYTPKDDFEYGKMYGFRSKEKTSVLIRVDEQQMFNKMHKRRRVKMAV